MTVPVTAASPAADETQPVAAETPAAEPKTEDVKPAPAESSPAASGDKPSLLEAVKASFAKPDDKETPPVSDTKPDPKDPAAKPEPEDEEEGAEDKGTLSEEEKKLLSEKTQRRIQRLARQRDDLKAPAQRTRHLDNYLQTNGISPADAKGAFETLALIRTNPKEALSRLRTMAYDLSLSIGETLPADIQEKVSKGVIDEATGRELAIARSQATGHKQVAETLSADVQETQARDFKNQVSQDVSAWEVAAASKDPDFKKKQPLIETEFRALLQSGEKIASPADAVRIMKSAYKNANEKIKAFRPASGPEVKPLSAPAAAAKTSPAKTHDEAVRRALNAA